MARAIYATFVGHDQVGVGDAAARSGYRRRLVLRGGGWATRADCSLYTTPEAAAGALGTLDPRARGRAATALLRDEGACPGVDDVVFLRAGRRERFALAATAALLW